VELLMGAETTGWGMALPEQTLTNKSLAASLDVSEEWIFERTGIVARRVAARGDTTASLAAAAGRQALATAGLDASELECVIVATCTPDTQIPATAPVVQSALGAFGAFSFDLNAGCSGFLFALAQADALISGGAARRVLVCGADVLSRVTDYSDARSCVLFGDGAGAVVLEEGEPRLGPFTLSSDGSRPELLWIPPGEAFIRMNGREVYRRAVEAMTMSVVEILEAASLSVRDVALLVAHQANARILEAVAARLGLAEEQIAINITNYGNTSAASIPIALAEAAEAGRLDHDDIVILTAFGAGFTWGAGEVRWGSSRSHRAPVPQTVGATRG
jgi:3-oxoacyl-[acyl-carrier-protein] synthase-3